MPIPFTTEDTKLAHEVLTYAQVSLAFAVCGGGSLVDATDKLLSLAAELRHRHGLLRCTTMLRQVVNGPEEPVWMLSVAYLPSVDRPLNVIDVVYTASLESSESTVQVVSGRRH